MEKYNDMFRIPSARLHSWDYGSPGLYFVTICTQNRNHYFGNVLLNNEPAAPNHHFVETQFFTPPSSAHLLQYTKIGSVAHQFWEQIPQFSPFIALDAFIVMPNHVHGILFLNNPEHNHWQPNKFGPQSKNLASVIRGYKAAVKKYATMHQIPFGWQSRYFDRVIRSEKELKNIRAYIYDNPSKWELEKNNPENLWM